MKVRKITSGFVVQEYCTESRRWVSQEFVASDDVQWEDENGEHIDSFQKLPHHFPSYLPFVMIQPQVNGAVFFDERYVGNPQENDNE